MMRAVAAAPSGRGGNMPPRAPQYLKLNAEIDVPLSKLGIVPSPAQ